MKVATETLESLRKNVTLLVREAVRKLEATASQNPEGITRLELLTDVHLTPNGLGHAKYATVGGDVLKLLYHEELQIVHDRLTRYLEGDT